MLFRSVDPDSGITQYPLDFVSGWDETPTHPKGAPTGMSVAQDGSVYIVEDRNRTILRLFYDPTQGNGIPTKSVFPDGRIAVQTPEEIEAAKKTGPPPLLDKPEVSRPVSAPVNAPMKPNPTIEKAPEGYSPDDQ